MTAIAMAFSVWDDLQECPHCGSQDIEYDITDGLVCCCDCGEVSAEILTDDMEKETWIINNLDRFDLLDIFLAERPGGDDPAGEFEDF